MKKLFLLFLLTPLTTFCKTAAKVVGISDGDTITVLLAGNIQKKLRFAEVDCPESSQPFGKNAKQFTSEQVFVKQILFIETDTDHYGRTIAKVYYYDDKYLSREIIKTGLGWWYYYFSEDKSLGDLQQHAKENKRGLWQDENAVAPWEYRKAIRNN
ncbi:nuclease [Chryseobacterium aquaticum]|uniref:Nuclease n=1 Tax=Chryseobacterium aquaticum TaxID=452084 RepID=A0A848N3Y5_9FLAO|nr:MULTISPECIES: thermonuclease family protein [Chryseobacterium]NMR34214.1 nuclease [Chryseobacterium aquaticum]NRQ46289.1 thermonuclease family protein [Chryseobacterium sp. C-204]